jgi:hypothetical protein
MIRQDERFELSLKGFDFERKCLEFDLIICLAFGFKIILIGSLCLMPERFMYTLADIAVHDSS